MFLNINVDAFLAILPQALLGWAGVFIVTIVVIFSIWLLNRITSRKKDEKSDQ